MHAIELLPWLGFELRTFRSRAKCANHYTTVLWSNTILIQYNINFWMLWTKWHPKSPVFDWVFKWSDQSHDFLPFEYQNYETPLLRRFWYSVSGICVVKMISIEHQLDCNLTDSTDWNTEETGDMNDYKNILTFLAETSLKCNPYYVHESGSIILV